MLLKDNHIDAAGGVALAIDAARASAPFVDKIEVECETLEMVQEAVEAGADIIMLDNMNHDQMLQAVTYIAGRAKRKLLVMLTQLMRLLMQTLAWILFLVERLHIPRQFSIFLLNTWRF